MNKEYWDYRNFLAHYGIKGQKWGVRRYQNEDGTLTEEGKNHYYNKHEYGDIEVNRSVDSYLSGDYPVYNIRRRGGKASSGYKISEENYLRMHREAEKEAFDWASSTMNRSVKDLRRDADRNPEDAKGAEMLINTFMHMKLDENLKRVEDINRREKEEKKRSREARKKSGKTLKYDNRNFTQKQAINQVYKDLEKAHPNFNKLPQDKQDELFWKYANSSGLGQYF